MNIAGKAVEPGEEAEGHSRETTVDPLGPTLGFSHQSSSSFRYRISALFSLFLLPTARANPEIAPSGGWEDFANNLGSDLAPLLALFGEQVTKQYLSEALTTLDCLLFALAPLGIITAIISAIRVAGSPGLRALVGRAKESRGSVEADLMSSTSADVCELWNGEGVVRVLGRPILLQLVCFNESGGGGEESEQIYTFREAVELGLYRAQGGAGDAAADDENPQALENPPNLSLNVSVKPLGRWTLVGFVVAGVLLQAGVLAYAAVSQYWLKLKKNDQAPVAYGLYVLLMGTISLAAGMFGCALIVERSTAELTWVPVKEEASKSVIWLQQGGQTVGDQRFESFARIVHGSGNILSSHKSAKTAADTGDTWDDETDTNQQATKAFGISAFVTATVATAFIGFILQFLGLRVMHATVTIAQLGAILIMTALRSCAYIQRDNRNEIKYPDQIEGHELDWLAENLTDCREWQVIAGPAENEGELQAVTNAVVRLMTTRARLAKLSMDWRLDVRGTVEVLKVVLEATINDVFAKMTLAPGVKNMSEFVWNIPVKAKLKDRSMESGNIALKLKRSKDDNSYWRAWEIEKSELEAVLSLWVFSITTLSRRRKRGQSSLKPVWLLDLATDEAVTNHKLWIHRGTTPKSMPLDPEALYLYFGWAGTSNVNSRAAPTSNPEQYLTVERDGALVSVCAQSLYTSFLFNLASKITDVGGITARRTDESATENSSADHWSQFQLSNSNLASLAAIYNESLLGTVEEAYFSIVPAFCAAKRLPFPREAYKEARATSARLSKEEDWEKATEIDSWLYSNSKRTGMSQSYVLSIATEIIGRLRTSTETLLAGHRVMSDTTDERLSRQWNAAYMLCRMITEPSVNLAICAVNLYVCHQIIKPNIDSEASYQSAQSILVGLPLGEERSNILAKLFSFRKGPLFLGDGIEKYLSDPASLRFAAMTTVYTGKDNLRKQVPRELLLVQGFRTPLQFASEVGHAGIVKQLLVAGANIDADPGKYNGRTALQAAAEGGHLDIVNLLLKAGADFNAVPAEHNGRTALQAAAGAGHEDIVKLLVSTGAEVNTKLQKYNGRTALQAAAEGGHLDIVNLLLKAGADLNAVPSNHEGRTALQAAIEGGHLDVVDQLLEKGADVNAKPSEHKGKTALQAAAAGAHLDVVDRLLNKGADINAEPSVGGRTALQAAAEGGHLDTVNLLLKAGADPNAEPSRVNGRTALQAAAEGGHLNVVARLFGGEADVNAKPSEHNGRTALQAAAEGGHLDVINQLLKMGASAYAGPSESNGRIALQAAAEGGHLDVVDRLLVEAGGVNVEPSKQKGRTALQAAAAGGHLDVVDRLLEEGADVNAEPSGDNGRTALQAAAEGAHLDVIDRLFEKGADVNAIPSNIDGRTALQAAAEGGHLDVVDQLLEKGADVNAEPSEQKGRTALQAAADRGHLDVVDQLLEKGADVNAEPSVGGRTALQAAAAGRHLDVLNRLFEKGADVNAEPSGDSGRTALQAAAEGGHLDLVDRLLENGADVNAKPSKIDGRTALQAAIEGGHLGVVDRLLEKGADVNVKPSEHNGKTALQAAAAGRYLDLLDRLFEKGADVNAEPSRVNGRTALQAAAEGGHLDVIDRLLEKGADVNAEPSGVDGRTALQAAAGGGHLDVVDQLLEKGAHVNAKPLVGGRTALQAAAEGGHLGVVDRLLEKGADVNAKPSGYDGRTALQAAAEGGHLDVVDRLFEKGADVNAKPSEPDGRTALQAAAERGHLDVVNRLLEKGADVNAKPSVRGRAALQAAAAEGHLDMVDRLLEKGADVNYGPVYGGSALWEAKRGKHQRVVARLLKAKGQ